MRCFYHDTRDAVGTCKLCGKGLCAECAVDLERGLACRGRCESEVADLIALITQNVQMRHSHAAVMGNVRSNTFLQAALMTVFGVVFLGMGLHYDSLMPYLTGLSVAMFAAAGIAAWRALRFPKRP